MTLEPEATIFVVDDDQAARDSLRWLLESVDLRVQTFDSAAHFLDAYQPGQPGCLVLDVRMPGMSGLELQDLLADRQCNLPTLFITGHGDVPMAVRAMKAGAMDFIEKPFHDQTLLERIQQCLARGNQLREESATRAAWLQRIASLTPREREVLDMIVGGSSNKAVASALGISIKTVEAHRANVMEKMSVSSLAELVAACVGCGAYRGKP